MSKKPYTDKRWRGTLDELLIGIGYDDKQIKEFKERVKARKKARLKAEALAKKKDRIKDASKLEKELGLVENAKRIFRRLKAKDNR